MLSLRPRVYFDSSLKSYHDVSTIITVINKAAVPEPFGVDDAVSLPPRSTTTTTTDTAAIVQTSRARAFATQPSRRQLIVFGFLCAVRACAHVFVLRVLHARL